MRFAETRCVETAMLRKFLDEELNTADEQRVSKHLGSCRDCRMQVEAWLSCGDDWNSLRYRLADFDSTRFLSEAELSTQSQAEEPFDNIRHLLAPTDDPTKLGRLGKYEICGVIGRGSAGVVCKAYDPNLNRFVAIKILMPSYANNVNVRRRFEREGRAIAAVRDANVVQVHGVDEFQGTPYIVMQYVPAGSLQKRLEEKGWFSTTEVCRIGMQIASGLEAAHRQGIVHRDIKPANVLLEDGLDRAIVSDFGLARIADEATMTHSGFIAGTPQFMSPEQAKGQSLDVRSDLFSLGGVLYACCTGESPFQAESLMGVIHKVCESKPRDVRELNPEIAEWLSKFIDKLLAKQREDRFETAGQVASLLSNELTYLQMPTQATHPTRDWLVNEHPQTTRRQFAIRSIVAIAIAIVACVLGSTLWSSRLSPEDSSGVNRVNQLGIEPTDQERNYFKAKAAYDLAYETHLSEAALKGDMRQSIDRHQEALRLGYDKAKSNFLLARAYAFQDDPDQAFECLKSAIKAGFHDVSSLQSDSELDSIRDDVRFKQLIAEARELAYLWQTANTVYFRDGNYTEAISRLHDWLERCPNDDLAVTLMGASYTELGETTQATIWNERARHTIQYAKFANYNQGCVALSQGKTDTALAYLKYAIETGFTDADHMENDHMLFSLRNDLRFQELVRELRQAG